MYQLFSCLIFLLQSHMQIGSGIVGGEKHLEFPVGGHTVDVPGHRTTHIQPVFQEDIFSDRTLVVFEAEAVLFHDKLVVQRETGPPHEAETGELCQSCQKKQKETNLTAHNSQRGVLLLAGLFPLLLLAVTSTVQGGLAGGEEGDVDDPGDDEGAHHDSGEETQAVSEANRVAELGETVTAEEYEGSSDQTRPHTEDQEIDIGTVARDTG